jgi:tetratricopeptide (TPR) repeat protein
LLLTLFKVLLLFSVQSCQTQGPGSSTYGHRDGEEVVRGEVKKYTPESLPPEMWSPQQRRGTASYYFLLAEYAGYHGQAKDALNLYQGAYNLDPNSYLGTKVAAARASVGDFPGATKEAERLILLYPKHFRLRFLYGSLLLSAGKVEDGIAEFRKSIELKADFEPSYLPIIDYYIAKKNLPEAEKISKRLTEVMPWSANAWIQLTRCQLLQEKSEASLVSAKTAFELQPDAIEPAMLYAVALELNKENQAALQVYEQIYFSHPVSDELLDRIVELYKKMGDLHDAIARIEKLLAESPDARPGIEIHKALILEELRRFDEALAIYQKLLAVRPEDNRLKFLTARAFERTKNKQQALTHYEAIGKDSPLRVSGDIRRTVILNDLGRHQEAEAILGPLLHQGDQDPKLVSFYASVLAEQNKFKEAIKVISEAYERWPQETRFLFLKGVYQERGGDIDACIATMREVLKVDPLNSSAYNYLGYLFVEQKTNLDEAEKLIKKALELKPDDGYYFDSLGWLYYQKGDMQKALQNLMRANELAPGEGVILQHIGEVYWALGEQDKAKLFFAKAFKGRLEEKEKILLQELLRKLKIPEESLQLPDEPAEA